VGWFSAVGRSSGVARVEPRTDSGALVGVKRRFLLELQWRGREGRFHHLAVRRPGPRRVTGALGVVTLFALALGIGGTFSAGTDRTPARFGVAAVLRDHAALKARHDVLREQAFDLAEQLYARVEQGRRMLRMAGTTGLDREGACPRPPARDAGDEAIFMWLSEQGARLEAIGNELTAGRVEMGVKQASARAPVSTETVPVGSTAVLVVADIGSAGRRAALPAGR
jgi:hypothetical protein